MSKRVYVIVEGPTEQKFVDEILTPYLCKKEIYLYPRKIGKVGQQGGDVRYSRVERDIKIFLKQQADTYVTLLVDYYGIDSNWPGFQDSLTLPTVEAKATCVNKATKALVVAQFGENGAESRFIPFVTMHEFEALLFSDCVKLAEGVGVHENEVKAILDKFSTPEEINNSPLTAPSKRLDSLVGGKFMKTTSGIAIAKEIGVDKMREKCSVFNTWLTTIEGLA